MLRGGDVLADLIELAGVDGRDLPLAAVDNLGLDSVVALRLSHRSGQSAHGVDGVGGQRVAHGADLQAVQVFRLGDRLVGNPVTPAGQAVGGQQDDALIVQLGFPLLVQLGLHQLIELGVAFEHVRHHQDAHLRHVSSQTGRVGGGGQRFAEHAGFQDVVSVAHFGRNESLGVPAAHFVQTASPLFVSHGLGVSRAVGAGDDDLGVGQSGDSGQAQNERQNQGQELLGHNKFLPR